MPLIPPPPAKVPSTSDPTAFPSDVSNLLQWFVDISNWVNDSLITGMQSDISALQSVVVDLQAQIERERIPVGCTIERRDNINPAVSMGYGTWELLGINRTSVGAGGNYTGGQLFGSDTKVLNTTHMPRHSHTAGTLSGTTTEEGEHAHGISKNFSGGNGTSNSEVSPASGDNDIYTNPAGKHGHGLIITGSTGENGSGAAFSVVQAGIGLYRWVRTS